MLGYRLKKLRLERKLTQEALGEKVNVTKVSISGYENGNRNPDTETLQRLADFFGVSTDYLLGRTDEKTPAQKDKLRKQLQLKHDEQIFFYDMEGLTDEEIELLKNQIELYRQISEKRVRSKKKGEHD